MAPDITTIKISKNTKDRLEHLRIYKRESYEEIMEKIMSILNLCRVDPERARSRLVLIDKERKINLKLKIEEKSLDILEKKKPAS
ncbi:MAG: hypothetical protein AABW65_02865 [Nanoarchaeota archaeon]